MGGQDITKLPPHERARRGIAYVPQGREIFPRLSVLENLQTGFAPLPRKDAQDPEGNLRAVSGAEKHAAPARRRPVGRPAAATRHRPRPCDRPRLIILDEPTEGIQPSIIKLIEAVIRKLGDRGDMAILLVEQYFEFARDLADHFAVMDRGEVVLAGPKAGMVEADIRKFLTV